MMVDQVPWSRDVCTIIPSDQGYLHYKLAFALPLTTLGVQDQVWRMKTVRHCEVSPELASWIMGV